MKKYGLQLRVPPSQQKKQASKPPLRPLIFSDDIDEDIGGDIARQAANKRVLREVEEQHKKALEEDPSVFDYDGVYDEMKVQTALPIMVDRQERQSKYIHTLMAKAKEREREQEVVYDRKLAKERSKEDHLFADKEKFVTGAYKRKLAETAKWLEEERIRQLREEKDDVTKKSDISDFYFNLGKNVAFGAGGVESSVAAKKEVKVIADTSERDVSPVMEPPSRSRREKDGDQADFSAPSETNGFSAPSETHVDTSDGKLVPTDSLQVSKEVPKPVADQSDQDLHKKPEAALSAAKERFMARKRAKQQ